MRYRSRADIVADILEVAQAGARKTRIMYEAFLSYPQLKEYLQLLTDSGLLEYSENKYHTTEKGRFFLKVCQKMNDMMPLEESKKITH